MIPQTLITFDDAVRRTLKEEEKLVNSSDWGYDALAFARWRPEYGYFPKQAGFTAQTPASLSALWQVVNRLGGKEGYFSAIFCGRRAPRWTVWWGINWRKAARRIPCSSLAIR